MTVARLLRLNVRSYALVLLLFGAFAMFLYCAFGLFAAAYIGVAYAVMILRDIGYLRRTVALWPLTVQVLEWSRIEELAASPDASSTRAA